MIVECRPDGVAASPSQQPLGGSVVHDTPAMEVEAVVVDGPAIVSPTLPSLSAPVVEVIVDGDVPHLAGARPSAPVLAYVGCQTGCGDVSFRGYSSLYGPSTAVDSGSRVANYSSCMSGWWDACPAGTCLLCSVLR